MAGTTLLALLDDIASMMDDIATMSKLATKKTIGVVGDDLALNAKQIQGVHSDRELSIIFKIFVGSLLNKAILVPIAIVLSYFAPKLISHLLIVGGIYLCFEGIEKIFHKKNKEIKQTVSEKDKIKGAIKTDFILSAEIVAISLASITNESTQIKILTLSLVSIILTLFIYLSVAIIIKFDDFGIWLSNFRNILIKKMGYFILLLAPFLMKTLSVVGTVAMFLVGGSIISHGIHLKIEIIPQTLNDILFGFVSGLIVYFFINIWEKVSK